MAQLPLHSQVETRWGVLNKLTSNVKFPLQKFEGEVHIPGMNFAGPGTRLDLRLNENDTPKQWSYPVDRVDLAAYYHDDLCSALRYS